jgi:UDP-hydrolysing UDP-N-acetyl-D-glucosamine 2-epimerase
LVLRKVCFAVIDRANYGRLKPVMEAYRAINPSGMSVLCGGSTPLARFKDPAQQIADDGFNVVGRLYSEIEGSVGVSMARSGGLAQMDFAQLLHSLKPDAVYGVGDRYQMVAVAMASVTLGIPFVHQQGGEVSGALDERYRHAITKLADWHVPATEQARDNLIRMGERPDSILAVGCPSADLAARIKPKNLGYILIVFHPDTNCPERGAREVTEVLTAVACTKRAAMVHWPNVDAGSDAVSKAIRIFREKDSRPEAYEWEYITNVEPERYLHTLANAACAVGNSSSFVRDSSFLGTPVVLVGNRQDGRECGENVMRVPCEFGAIRTAIDKQLLCGRYFPSDLYGKPGISQEIAERLATLEPLGDKRLEFYDVRASRLEAVA